MYKKMNNNNINIGIVNIEGESVNLIEFYNKYFVKMLKE